MHIAIIEDHPDVRDQLRNTFESTPGFEVMGYCKDLSEGLALIEKSCPDILLVDLCLPKGGDGTVAIRRAQYLWGTRCISAVLTAHRNEEYLLDPIRAGAKGFLDKNEPHSTWPETVLELSHGMSPINEVLAKIFQKEFQKLRPTESSATRNPKIIEFLQYVAAGYTLNDLHGNLRLDKPSAGRMARSVYDLFFEESRALSARELELLHLLAQGIPNKSCAQKMGVAETTIKTFIQRMYEKLGVTNRREAILASHRQGILP